MRVLAGDIGGTKTWLRLAEFGEGAPQKGRVISEKRYESVDFPDLVPLLLDFMGGVPAGSVHAACFGIAGPILEHEGQQRSRLTNLPWELDSARIGDQIGLSRVRLINDFQAVGYGVTALEPADLAALQPAIPAKEAPAVVVGAGTGLGVGLLVWQGDHHEALPTEGGHVDFAPLTPEQDELLRWLRSRHGRVSYERILSGPGLEAIYRFLLEQEGQPTEADPILQAPDPAAMVSRLALESGAPRALHALDLFIEVYGSLAGNLALTCLARAGVFLAGGIAPKILPRLLQGGFIRAFNDKGRMAPLVEAMPVHVILDPKVGLVGAALAATRL